MLNDTSRVQIQLSIVVIESGYPRNLGSKRKVNFFNFLIFYRINNKKKPPEMTSSTNFIQQIHVAE